MSELLAFESSQGGEREISDSKRIASPTPVIVEPPHAKSDGEDEQTTSTPVPVFFESDRSRSPQMEVAGDLLLGELEPLPPTITFGDLSLLTPADGLLQRGVEELVFPDLHDIPDIPAAVQVGFGDSFTTAGGSHMQTPSPDSVISNQERGEGAYANFDGGNGDIVLLSPSSPSPQALQTELEVSLDAAIVSPVPELPQPELLPDPSPAPLPAPDTEVVVRSSSTSPLQTIDAEQELGIAPLHETSQQPVVPSQAAALLSRPVSPPSLPPSPPPPAAHSPSPPSSPNDEPDMPRMSYTEQLPRAPDTIAIINPSIHHSERNPTPTAESGTQPHARSSLVTRNSQAEVSLPRNAQSGMFQSSTQRNSRLSHHMEVQPYQHPLAAPVQPTRTQAVRSPPMSNQADEAEILPPSYDSIDETTPVPSRVSSRMSGYVVAQEQPTVRSSRSSQVQAVPPARAGFNQQVGSPTGIQSVPTRQSLVIQSVPTTNSISPAAPQGASGFAEEAPPTYNSLFGGSLSMSGSIARPSTHLPVPREEAIPMSQLGSRQQQQQQPEPAVGGPGNAWRPDPVHNRSCFGYAKKSPEKSGIYIGLFIIGVLVSVSMVTVGIIIFLTSSAEQTQGIYLMVMGGTSSFFVCWHSIALCTGVYVKSRDSDDKNYFILRVCNFGAFFLIIAAGVISYLVWSDLSNILNNFTVLQGIVIGFLVIIYVMTIYCVLECCIDVCSLLKSSVHGEPPPETVSYRRTARA